MISKKLNIELQNALNKKRLLYSLNKLAFNSLFKYNFV